MSNTMLEVNELTTKYITRFHEDVYAVDHVSLKVEEGKSLGIAGESGCGKSTLALSLMGYYFPPLHYTSGDIIINGRNISGMNPDEVRKLVLGAEIAYIPQAAMNASTPPAKSSTSSRMLFRNMICTSPRRIFTTAPESCSKIWGCQQMYWKNIRSSFRVA